MPLLETKGAASAQGFGEFAKSGAVNYIEEVFSTYLYTGNGATQSINNGIDLSTKGGLVWVKVRDDTYSHALVNTIQGGTGQVSSDSTAAQAGAANDWDSFTTTGFNVKAPNFDYLYNQNTRKYVSWSFRKQPKFFDVVTYTGNGANRTIAHNLGSVPGCIIIKRTNTTGAWAVYHRSLANTEYMVLNTTAAKATGATYWNSTTPTATEFSLGTATDVNANTGTYVAYLFAHDAGGFGLTGTDNVITCGSFTTDGSGNATVTLGYEPQWILVRPYDTTASWNMIDTMRGWFANTAYQNLFANSSNAESTAGDAFYTVTSTGFKVNSYPSGANLNFIYIVVRRGPMKVPTSGTTIYNADAFTGTGTTKSIITSLNAPDLVWLRNYRNDVYTNTIQDFDRLRGDGARIRTGLTNAETTNTAWMKFGAAMTATISNDGETNANGVSEVAWGFKRAPSFFDVVCFTSTGGGASGTQTHNLGVSPELLIVKSRSSVNNWTTYSSQLTSWDYQLKLNLTDAQSNTGVTTTVTATNFSLDAGLLPFSATCVAYLFATCPGVSKVGSYTGTGNTLQIDCGFTGGARFVLIKRTDSTGDWYLWDSTRGIVSGNDPYLTLNTTAAEVTNTDWVDTHNPGFELSNAAGNNVNINGASYIYLAIS